MLLTTVGIGEIGKKRRGERRKQGKEGRSEGGKRRRK